MWTTPTNFVAGAVVTEAMLDNLSDNLTTGVMRPIAESILSAQAASIDFTSIPATFRSLSLRIQARCEVGLASSTLMIRFNNDSGVAAYGWQTTIGSSTSASGSEDVVDSGIVIGSVAAQSTVAGTSGSYTVEIPFYAATTFNKTVVAHGGYRHGTNGNETKQVSAWGIWLSTAAINRITILATGGNLSVGSSATLYGVPGLA